MVQINSNMRIWISSWSTFSGVIHRVHFLVLFTRYIFLHLFTGFLYLFTGYIFLHLFTGYIFWCYSMSTFSCIYSLDFLYLFNEYIFLYLFTGFIFLITDLQVVWFSYLFNECYLLGTFSCIYSLCKFSCNYSPFKLKF